MNYFIFMIKLPLKSKTTNYVYLILLSTLLVLGVIDAFFPIGRANLFYLVIAALIVLISPYLLKALKLELSGNTYIAWWLFIIVACYFSNRYNLYKTFWFYDVILHTFSGVILAFFFSDLLYPLSSTKNYIKETPIIMIVAICWLCAIASAGIWEMNEFVYDIFTHQDVQRNLLLEKELISSSWQNSGILDTMNDMINGTVGGLVGSIFLFFKYKKERKVC